MLKEKISPFCVRISVKADPVASVDVLQYDYDCYHSALRSFQEALFAAVPCEYNSIELLELCDNDIDYNVIYHCELFSIKWS